MGLLEIFKTTSTKVLCSHVLHEKELITSLRSPRSSSQHEEGNRRSRTKARLSSKCSVETKKSYTNHHVFIAHIQSTWSFIEKDASPEMGHIISDELLLAIFDNLANKISKILLPSTATKIISKSEL